MKKKLSKKAVVGLSLLVLSTAAYTQTKEMTEAMKLKHAGDPAAAEMAFQAVLAKHPNNIKAIEQMAIVQSWQDKFADAVSNFKWALSLDENYTPARIGLARVSYWQGNRTFALNEMKRVLAEQPEEASNWVLQGDILLADSQYQQANQAYKKAKMLLGSKAPASLDNKIAHATPPKRWRVDAGYISDQFSDVRTDGHSSYLQLGYTFKNRTTVYARAEEYLSFDSTDTGLTVGAYYSPHKNLLLQGEYYTNNGETNFRPNDQFTINADFLFNKTWQPLLGYRTASYDILGGNGEEGDVITITPGLRFNYQNYSVEFRHARTENLDDTNTETNTVKVNANYENLSPYIFITDGEEGVPPLAVAEITTVGAGVVYKLNNSLSMRLDYSHEDRKGIYTHNALGVGISYFF